MSSFDPMHDPQVQVEELRRWVKKNRQRVVAIFFTLVAGFAVVSTAYTIDPEEVGVVLRFGKHVATTDPGLHFKLPFGIDRVHKVAVRRQQKAEFGFRTVRADVRSQMARNRASTAEAEMLTGDLNVATVEWSVQYVIAAPEKYLFRFRNIDATLRMMAEATMRSVVGDHAIDELMTQDREAIADQAKMLLTDLNRLYDTGIQIHQVKLLTVNVPVGVQPALREVEEARQERERMVNQAWAEYNKVVPRARGRAEQALQKAAGYAIERTNQAQGDAARFLSLQQAHKEAPKITQTRIYFESLGRILPSVQRKFIVDAAGAQVLPLLNLQPTAAATAR